LALNANQCSGKSGKKQPPGHFACGHINELGGSMDKLSFVDN
jgi:hypothetical protein